MHQFNDKMQICLSLFLALNSQFIILKQENYLQFKNDCKMIISLALHSEGIMKRTSNISVNNSVTVADNYENWIITMGSSTLCWIVSLLLICLALCRTFRGYFCPLIKILIVNNWSIQLFFFFFLSFRSVWLGNIITDQSYLVAIANKTWKNKRKIGEFRSSTLLIKIST